MCPGGCGRSGTGETEDQNGMNRLIRKIGRSALCAALCAALLLGSCGCGKKEEESPENHLFTYALSEEPASLDPQVASGEAALTAVRNLYEGLCRLDENGAAVPGAASQWDCSDDGRTYTFSIRFGAQWSDGTPLTAADFVYGIRRALEPKTRCPAVSELFVIAGAEAYYNGEGEWDDVGVCAVNSRTLRITLNVPDASFPAQTARSPYMPCSEAFFKSTGGRYGMEPEAVLCNGPFVLRARSGWVHGEYIRLVRNKNYVGEETVSPSGVMLKIEDPKEPADPVESVRSGKVNLARMSDEDAVRAERAGLQVISFAESTWGLAFNGTDGTFENESVRQAFLCAINRSELMTFYPEEAANTVNVIPAAITWHGRSYRRQAQNCSPLTSEQSPMQLLAQGLTELNRKDLPAISVLCVDTVENRLLVNQLLTDWRQTLGCYVNVETVADEGELEKRVLSGRYQIALTGIRAQEDSATAFLQQVMEITGWSGAEISAEMTLESVRAAEDRLIESGAFYPMYARSSCYALGTTVTGVCVQPFGGGIDFRRAGRTA